MSEPPKPPEEPEQPKPKKPLARLQAFLIELRTCVVLFREVCTEFKSLLVILVLILFFVIGVGEVLKRLFFEPPQHVEQIVTKPCDQARK